MTHRKDIRDPRSGTFSAAQYRAAMGPGYQVATFREQPTLLGNPPTAQPRTAIVLAGRKRRWRLFRAVPNRRSVRRVAPATLLRVLRFS